MATNIFLTFEGEEDLKGDSSDEGHKDQIEVLGWSHGFSQATSPVRSAAGSGTIERANHSDLTFTKYTDKSSPGLIKGCWSGKHFAKVLIKQYRAGGVGEVVDFINIEMTDVVISNFSISAGAGDLPVENISLAYGKVIYTYGPSDHATGKKAGSKPATHDLKTNVIS